MPHYYFHLRDGINAEDPEGMELPDLEAAQLRARAFVLDVAAETVREQRPFVSSHRIEVADEAGAIVCTVAFGDVVKVEP
jgi:hypothetical protein